MTWFKTLICHLCSIYPSSTKHNVLHVEKLSHMTLLWHICSYGLPSSFRLNLISCSLCRTAFHCNFHAAYQKGYETMALWVRRLDILGQSQMPVWAAMRESCCVGQTWQEGSITTTKPQSSGLLCLIKFISLANIFNKQTWIITAAKGDSGRTNRDETVQLIVWPFTGIALALLKLLPVKVKGKWLHITAVQKLYSDMNVFFIAE